MDAAHKKAPSVAPPKAARRLRDLKQIFKHRYPPYGVLPATDLGRRSARLYVDHVIVLDGGVVAAHNFLARCCAWMSEDECEELVRAAVTLAPQVPSDERAARELDLTYAERAGIRWQEQRTRNGVTKLVWQSIGSIAATDADMPECKRRSEERRVAAQAAQRAAEREERRLARATATTDAQLKGRLLKVYEAIGPNWIGIKGLAVKLKAVFGKRIAKKSIARQINRYCVTLIKHGLVEHRPIPGANNLEAREVRRRT